MNIRRPGVGWQPRGTRWIPLLLALAMSAFCTATAVADDGFSTPPMTESGHTPFSLYLSLSAGLGAPGPMGAANLTLGTGAFLLSARASHSAEFRILCRPEADVVAYSLLAGFRLRSDTTLLHAMAGAGYANVTRNRQRSSNGCWSEDSYETSFDRTVNIPLEVGAAWDARVVGIGFAIIANVNPAYPDLALVLRISLGKIR